MRLFEVFSLAIFNKLEMYVGSVQFMPIANI
jgi:hypothetical protein